VIRLIYCVVLWTFFSLIAAVVGFPALYLTGRIDLLWKLSLWAARSGYRLAGIRVRAVGREGLEDGRGYLFISNHASNLDPPIITNLLGRRIAIIAKQELFKIPLFGRAMREGSFVAVNRAEPRSAVESVHKAAHVLQSGMGMLAFPEGTRSPDGKLLPFKKGPFQLAMEAGVPVVPITITGSHEAWPKGSSALHAGEVVVRFHPAIDPHQFARKEELLAAVRAAIHSGLPEAYRDSATVEPRAR
jgi:1-acyl-sn-glycerol-3-phosphate acyltransferase